MGCLYGALPLWAADAVSVFHGDTKNKRGEGQLLVTRFGLLVSSDVPAKRTLSDYTALLFSTMDKISR